MKRVNDLFQQIGVNMQQRIYFTILCTVFITVFAFEGITAKEIRVWGGNSDDYTDSNGNVWYGGQKTNQNWGGWIEKEPRTAVVRELTAAAKNLAKNEGYDEELFYAVSWAQYPDVVKVDLKTGRGTFDVTYLVGEHWSPNNRGFDIIIEDEIVEALYITPGNHEIDIKRYEAIQVKDTVMNFVFSGNPDAGVTDRNAMFSGIEVVTSQFTVDPKQKLTTTWGALKNQQHN